MKSKFLIMGFTGPIGSGCTLVSEFLQKDLTHYKDSVSTEKENLISEINSYYRFLKTQQGKDAEQSSPYRSILTEQFISPEDLHAKILLTEGKPSSEQVLKTIHRKLRNLLVKRKVLDYFETNSWENFTYISMSSMLLKLVIENCINDKNEEAENFRNHSMSIFGTGKERIKEFSIKNRKELKQYDSIIDSKNFTELTLEFCQKIDDIFVQIKQLKKELLRNKEIDQEWLQDIGDNIRATGSPFEKHSGDKFTSLDILSFEANRHIKYHRRRKDGKANNYFAIDSFRNPAEIRFFRNRYGSFYLCALNASPEVRKEKLGNKFNAKVENRDQSKYIAAHDLHKQNVPSCALISDYAITNEHDINHFKYRIIRLLCLIDNPGFIPPSTDEVFMNFAYSLSLRSTCLSRQVGAVITNQDGFVIAGGWNDVGSGQMGCSLNCKLDFEKYSEPEYLLYNWKERIKEFKDNYLLKDLHDKDFLF